ncbi:MAG: hypothetical protein QOD40_1915 [Alphaproteobacteria bacterium]|jgi:hypothetical protein|nr:hypothetical protein [Alphaproteobacteria bacterium]
MPGKSIAGSPSSFRLLSATYFRLFIIGMGFIYVLMYVHTPLAVNSSFPHDDTLFMTIGRYLAEGRWLGPYDQFTLMKGPGYPAFLALTNWLGISVSLSHALFHCGAIAFFVAIAHKFMKSFVLSGLLFVLLLWHPIAIGPFLLRIIRESIYYGQILVFVGALAWACLSASGWRERAFYGALSGAVFGWFWLTREDGVWMVPAIAILLTAGGLRATRERTVREFAGACLVFVVVFAGTQIAFRSVNWWVYGKFVSVDSKEANFQRALGAINSVLSGGNRLFVPITRTARERVYEVSPSFKSVAIYLDGDLGKAYDGISCPLQPTSCGDIGSSVFLWALREAAAAAGQYTSPAKASAFFERVADEITGACSRGDLECNPQFIAEIPQVYREQFAQIPQGYLKVLDLLVMLQPSIHLDPSSGDEARLGTHLRFLNYPPHTASVDIPSRAASYRFLGWYYKSGRSWMTVAVAPAADLRFERIDSPDIASGFKDPEATRQRFSIYTHCSEDCILRFETTEGDVVERKLADLRAPIGFDLGSGRVNFDVTEVVADPGSQATLAENAAQGLREEAVTHYSYVFIPVLALGIIGFFVSTLFYWRTAIFNPCYVFALALWATIFVRITMLVIVEATWIQSIFSGHSPYLTSLYFLLVAAAVLSIAAWSGLRSPSSEDMGTQDVPGTILAKPVAS